MSRIVVMNHVTLDGVPLRLTDSQVTSDGVVIATYESTPASSG